MIRKAKAVWHGTGRAGNGNLSTDVAGPMMVNPCPQNSCLAAH
jgi:hypothetical protein